MQQGVQTDATCNIHKMLVVVGQQCFVRLKEWVNKVNLSSFELENFFKFVLA